MSSKTNRIRVVIILVIALGIIPSLLYGCGAQSLSGTYVSESGRYSVKFESDGNCTWYQDSLFFNGTYEKTDSGWKMEILGNGWYGNTVFSAEKVDENTLIINGGMVDDETFLKQ